MSKGIIVSPANRGVQVVVTDENNVQLLVDSNRGVNLEIVPQPRIEVLVDKGVEGAQGPAGEGVPTGGTTGQVLAKASNANYDTVWATITGTLVYQGSWNASTNTPTLTSSVGTNGYYYVVGTSGSTNLNGITDWVVGDWAIFNGSVWQKIDNTDLVSSVNGQTGVVVLDAADVGAFPATPTTGSGNVVLDTAPTLNNPTISNYEAFTPSSVPSYVEGRTWYDSNKHALAYYNDSSNDVVHIGQDLIVKVINNTGSTIPNGSPVYITSTSSGQSYPNIALAKADVAATSAVIGLTNGSIANGAIGYVTSQGGIDNVNTSTFTVGQVLYLSPYSAGQLMNTLPPTGITVQVGVVQYVNSSTGIIYVKQTTPLSVPASIITGTLPIANGGTGATTASGARTNLGLGTIATQDASNVAITGGTIDNTVIGGTTPAAGTFTTLTATGQTSLGGVAGAEGLRVNTTASANRYLIASGSNGGTPSFGASAGALVLYGGPSQGIAFYSNGYSQAQFNIAHTASAVNYVQVTGAATTASPIISAQGSDSNISLRLDAKGGGSITFITGGALQAAVQHTASSINYLGFTGSTTGNAVRLFAAGTDTNISQVFQSKGTGAIDLAAGSSGVNISNGGTVTAITRTATGSGYTSVPSVALTAPTTAGGVQATGNAIVQNTNATIANGGTGYTVGDTITMVGGTLQSGGAGTFRVATVSGGVITSVDTPNYSQYSAVPTNPVSVTGGTGTGATLTVSYIFGYVVITNAGSGYVEQPTVSFSGGGGSGAAAYATVGSGTVVKGLGTNFDVFTANANRAFRFYDSNSTGVNYWSASNGTTPVLYATGSSNTSAAIITNGTGSVSFQSAGGASTQMQAAHTASAVNYVQVTGAATGGGPAITAQGSDSSINLALSAKGTGGVFATTYFGAGTASTNYIQLAGASTSVPPTVKALGGDTNIPLVLQPKGTGALQAQQTDSTATGGNARGANAVDWQTSRSTSARIASAQFSVVSGGNNNAAQGYSATASGGESSLASGAYSYVGGGSLNTASSTWSATVGGASNVSAGLYNFVGGGFTNAGTSGSAVTTQSATMNGTTAVTLSGSNASIKVGQYITGTSISGDTYVAAVSGTSLTLSKVASGSSTSTLSFYTPHGVVVGGGNNQATGSYSFIGGGGDAGTAANRNRASGDWSIVVGGIQNTASGIGSFIGGGGTYGSGFAGNAASGTSTFVGAGYLNSAGGFAGTVVGGSSNFQTLNAGFIGGGANNTVNSSQSVISGGTYGTTRSIEGSHVFPACNNPIASASGVSQSALLILGTQTTDATATVLRSNTSAASTTNQVILPNNSAYTFRGEIVSGVTGGGNSKSWTIEGLIKRGANAASTTLVGSTVTSMYADAGAVTWTIALSADTTNGGLAVTFTGQASTTIRTVCSIRTTEMTF